MKILVTESKVCFKCGAFKPLPDFYKHPKTKDGRLNKCKICARQDTINWNQLNKGKKKEQGKKWYNNNKKKLGIVGRVKFSEGELKARRRVSSLKYAHKRRDLKNNTSKFSKYPQEFKDLFWEEIFKHAKLLEFYLNIEYQVDHIIPLNGKSVNGFHIPENVRLLTKRENLVKSNRY